MTPPAIAVIGVGDIGLPVAQRLLGTGRRVLVFDVDPAARHRAARAGLDVVGDLGDLAGQVAVASVVVPDDDAVRAVTIGPGGLVDMRIPTVVVHATVRPSTVVEVGEVAARAGVVVVEAALSGGAAAAEIGDLTVLRAGPSAGLVADAVLADLGRVHDLGGWGAGQVAKLANNLVLGGTRLLALEALAIGAAHGIPEDRLVGLLVDGTASCWALQHWGEVEAFCDRAIARGDRAFLGKDVCAALELADRAGLAAPVTRVVGRTIVAANVARSEHRDDQRIERGNSNR